MDKIAAIVLNWKTPTLSVELTKSLICIDQRGFKCHVVLVDNGSTDDSYKIFKDTFAQNHNVTLIETGNNLGYAAGNNVGILYALKHHYDYILIINSDVIVDPSFLKKMYDFNKKNPQYSIISPKIYFAPGHEFHLDRYKLNERGKVIWSAGGYLDWNNIYGTNIGIDEVDHGQFDIPNDKTNFLSGCCLLVNTKVYKKIKPFDPSYFMYLEDADFCQRAIMAGFKLIYYPKSVIWHINAGSSTAGASPLQDYFLTRNRYLIGFKYASLRTKFALFRDSLRTLFTSPSLWQKRGVIDYYLKRLGKGSWGK